MNIEYELVFNLCKILADILNYIIFILAIVETCLAVKAGVQLKLCKKRIDSLNNPVVEKKKVKRKIKGVIITPNGDSVKRWSDFELFRSDFQKKMKTYTAFTLTSSLFTLLGILGTVAGLYVAMRDMESAENLFEGVKFALSSTVLGITFAIVFKIVDIYYSSNLVTHIDEGIDIYEKNYTVDSNDAMQMAIENKGQDQIG